MWSSFSCLNVLILLKEYFAAWSQTHRLGPLSMLIVFSFIIFPIWYHQPSRSKVSGNQQIILSHTSWHCLALYNLFLFVFLIELKGPVGQMIQSDNRGLLAVEKNKVQAVEQKSPGRNSHTRKDKGGGCSSEIVKITPGGTKVLFCGRGLKFSPLGRYQF